MPPSDSRPDTIEFVLLGLLALLWGGSYLFSKVALVETPPITLVAARVAGAALFLLVVMRWTGDVLPRDARTWRMLLLQALFNSIGAWTILAWGQQHIDAGLASVLNSTSPIFVFAIGLGAGTALVARQLGGAVLGVLGVLFIVGIDVLDGLGDAVLGQLACLAGAVLYAAAALYGRRFAHVSPLATATGTMIWASIVLVPAALLFERPWELRPSASTIGATVVIAVFCTGLALLVYFRLVRTLGSMGVASQSYLRAGVGVMLGTILLGEQPNPTTLIGLLAVIAGVALINWPTRQRLKPGARTPREHSGA